MLIDNNTYFCMMTFMTIKHISPKTLIILLQKHLITLTLCPNYTRHDAAT